MGVAGAGAAVLAATVALAAVTGWLERLMLPQGAEPGAAAPLDVRRDLRLPHRDAWMESAGPVVALLGVALAMVVLPFGPGLVGADLGIGAFYVLVVVDFVVLGAALSGWGVNVGRGVEVYYRITAQLVSYVVPLGLAYLGPLMMARSLSTQALVAAQGEVWFVVLQPLGFALYLVTGLMQCYRAPFLEPFSEYNERGFLPLVGGWRALLWRLALSGLLFVVAAMGAVLFLGGWLGPVLPGPVWMLLKTFGMMAFMLWAGRKVRLLSTASMLELSWKVLTPVGLLNVLVVGGLILLGVGPA